MLSALALAAAALNLPDSSQHVEGLHHNALAPVSASAVLASLGSAAMNGLEAAACGQCMAPAQMQTVTAAAGAAAAAGPAAAAAAAAAVAVAVVGAGAGVDAGAAAGAAAADVAAA